MIPATLASTIVAFIRSPINQNIKSDMRENRDWLNGLKIFLAQNPPRNLPLVVLEYNRIYPNDKPVSRQTVYRWYKKGKWEERAEIFDSLVEKDREHYRNRVDASATTDILFDPENKANLPELVLSNNDSSGVASVLPISRHQLMVEMVTDVGTDMIKDALIEYRAHLIPAIKNMQVPEQPTIREGATLVKMGLDLVNMARSFYDLRLEAEGIQALAEELNLAQ